jgi:hypothetical protein
VLLDDRGYVTLLKLCLARAGYTAGPLFHAGINGAGGSLSYDAAHHRRQRYCATAGVDLDVSPRPRRTDPAQLYALLDDKVADAEIRAPGGAVTEWRADHTAEGGQVGSSVRPRGRGGVAQGQPIQPLPIFTGCWLL